MQVCEARALVTVPWREGCAGHQIWHLGITAQREEAFSVGILRAAPRKPQELRIGPEVSLEKQGLSKDQRGGERLDRKSGKEGYSRGRQGIKGAAEGTAEIIAISLWLESKVRGKLQRAPEALASLSPDGV